jgi:murein DD-endopeptidase MepM/ murein hydrolase activator NlpD
MESQQFFSKARLILPATLMFVTLNAFTQNTSEAPEKERSEVTSRQLHSTSLSESTGFFADGLKLKMDLSVLEEAEDRRESFDPNEIPADDIYGGLWMNKHVNIYGSLENAPDTFMVDLENFTMPANGHMTSNFGRRGSRRYHYGIDIKAQTGDTIYAAFDGKIRVKQFEKKGYGYYLVIRHVNGLETVYGHLSKFLVDENEFVRSGQPIGLAGNTGRSYGSHLHFETRFLGKPINPNFIIDFDNKVTHRDEYLVTNSSYRKTTNSSKVLVTNPAVYKEPTTTTNKYVSGDVKYHRIKSGDTLGAISRQYGISIKDICDMNNITTKTVLRVGKTLRIS